MPTTALDGTPENSNEVCPDSPAKRTVPAIPAHFGVCLVRSTETRNFLFSGTATEYEHLPLEYLPDAVADLISDPKFEQRRPGEHLGGL